MKTNFKILSIVSVILIMGLQGFAKTQDSLDQWLDKYETFIEKVEKGAKNNQVSKIEKFRSEKKALFAEKDSIQKAEGNFTVKQGVRYAELNTRWGIAYGALNTTKGIKKASNSIDEFLEENPQPTESENKSTNI